MIYSAQINADSLVKCSVTPSLMIDWSSFPIVGIKWSQVCGYQVSASLRK